MVLQPNLKIKFYSLIIFLVIVPCSVFTAEGKYKGNERLYSHPVKISHLKQLAKSKIENKKNRGTSVGNNSSHFTKQKPRIHLLKGSEFSLLLENFCSNH